MSRVKKAISIILLLLVLPVLIEVFLNTQSVVDMPLRFGKLRDLPYLGSFVPTYLFWVSAISICVILIGVIIIIFYPKKYSDIVIEKNKGTLSVSSKAVESFVMNNLQKEYWLSNPKVSCKLKKDSADIAIQGKFYAELPIDTQLKRVKQSVATELAMLLGLKDTTKVNVAIKDYAHERQQPSRVC